jgi:hypothetical protein
MMDFLPKAKQGLLQPLVLLTPDGVQDHPYQHSE